MNANKILKYVFFIAIGAIMGYISTNWSFFTFKSEIGVIEILNVLVTVFLGYYIASTIQKRQGASRIEKDWIINEVQKIRQDIDKIRAFLERDSIPLNEALPVFKNLSSNISEAIELSKLCKYSDTSSFEEIRKNVNVMKRIVTNPRPSNDCFILGDSSKSKITVNHKKTKELIFKLIVSINRSNI